LTNCSCNIGPARRGATLIGWNAVLADAQVIREPALSQTAVLAHGA